MLKRAMLMAALLAAPAIAIAQDAESYARTVQFLAQKEVFRSASMIDGVATLVVGPRFGNAEFNSKRDVVRSAAEHLKSRYPETTFVVLRNEAGAQIGVYSNGTLTLN